MKSNVSIKRFLIIALAMITVGIAFYGLGCGGGGGGSTDTNPPGISDVIPPDRSTITNSTSIVFKFSETMDTSSLVLGGAFGSDSDGGSWATTTNENDTLTVKPKTSWSLGTGTLTVAVNDVAGNPLPVASASKEATSHTVTYGVQVIYVKQGGTGDGTMDNAMDNINDAIAAAKGKLDDATWATGAHVEVAKGTYEVTSGTDHIVMEEGVSLYGGYSDSDWTARDVAANITTIKDIISGGGTKPDPNRTIQTDIGITSATVIDGFTIQGSDGAYTTAILNNNGASPTISNNTIVSGSGTGACEGIYNSGNSSPIIHHNTIQGGASGDLTIGIYSNSSSPLIYNNTIHGGGGSKSSVAIYNETSSSPTIYNNSINGGIGGGVFASSYGILNDGNCSAMIYNNTIDGGTANDSYGIFNFDSSTPSIYNNTINAGNTSSWGIYNELNSRPKINNNIIFSGGGASKIGISEQDVGSDPVEVKNNDVFNCPKALYDDITQSYLTEICTIGTFGRNGCSVLLDAPTVASGNISTDPMFVDQAGGNWHLTSSSPAPVTQGGLDGSALGWGFTTDKDGNTRTAPWSTGAYEYD